jgi:hypothetical protein
MNHPASHLSCAFLMWHSLTAYSHNLFRRGHRYLCEFMERTKQTYNSDQSSRLCAAKLNAPISLKVMMSKKTVERNSFTAMVPFHPDEKVDERYYDEAWTPAVVTVPSANQMQASQIYNSFMDQEWNALPEGVTPMTSLEISLICLELCKT